MSDQPNVKVFAERKDAAESLAAEIVRELSDAVRIHGRASFAGAGGSSPVDVYTHMSRLKAPWSQITITLTDERWVDDQSDESNARMMRTQLLRGEAAAARFVGLKTAHETPTQGRTTCAAALRTVPRPLDVVLLGMGEDGHMASFFPGAEGLEEALDLTRRALCVPITQKKSSASPAALRMSLTLRTIVDARACYLLLFGEAKRKVFEKAWAAKDDHRLPVGAVLHNTALPVKVYWAP